MNSIMTITLNDLRIFFADRGNLFGLIVLPLAFTLVLGFAFGSGDSGPTYVRIDVLDEDGTAQSALFMDELRAANTTLVLCPIDNDTITDEEDFCRLGDEPLDLERAQERAKEETTDALIVIPAGYADAVTGAGDATIQFYAMNDPGVPHPVLQTVSTVLQKINSAGLTAGVTNAMLENVGMQTGLGMFIDGFREQFVDDIFVESSTLLEQRPDAVQYVTSEGVEEADPTDGLGQSVPGMGTMFVMFTVLAGTAALLRERNQWTLQRLAALPLSRAYILSGKILTYIILGMIQYFIVFGVGLAVGLNLGDSPLLLLPIMLAFVLCTTALTFAIAPLMKSVEQAGGITRLLSLSLAPLGGAWWPLEIVPDFMRTIGYLSPVSWAMYAFQDVMWFGGGLADILPEIGVLLAATVVLFVIGVRSFRYGS